MEPGHPRILSPDDVNRNTIGHVGHSIYDVNDSPIYISHTFDLTDVFIWIQLYNLHVIYILYIRYKIYRTYKRCIFFLFSGIPAWY